MNNALLIGGLAAYFIALIGISLYRRRSDTEGDYFLGGNRLPAWMLAMAFVATWYGGNSALVSVDEANTQGMGSWWVLGGPTIVAVVVLIFLAPVIRRVGMLSQDAIMSSRYSPGTGALLSVVMSIYMIVWGASQMVALGLFFSAFFDIAFPIAVALGIIVAIVYATIGGFRAVVLTETIQFALLLLGLVVTMVGAIMLSGGWDVISRVASEQRDPGYFNLFSGFWPNLTYIVSFGLAFIIDGAAWQRIQAARSPGQARRTSVSAMVYFIPLYFLVVISGIGSIGIFPEVPENGVVATLANEEFAPVFGLIVFIGIAAAIMSTVCTTLNLSSLYMTELWDKARGRRDSDRFKVKLGMVFTVVAAVLGFIVAVLLPSALALLALASEFLAAGLFFPLILGFFWKRGNTVGAIASIICGGGFILYGFLVELGVALPHFWEGGATRILLGMAVSGIAYFAGSLLTRPETAKAEAFTDLARGRGVGAGAGVEGEAVR